MVDKPDVKSEGPFDSMKQVASKAGEQMLKDAGLPGKASSKNSNEVTYKDAAGHEKTTNLDRKADGSGSIKLGEGGPGSIYEASRALVAAQHKGENLSKQQTESEVAKTAAALEKHNAQEVAKHGGVRNLPNGFEVKVPEKLMPKSAVPPLEITDDNGKPNEKKTPDQAALDKLFSDGNSMKAGKAVKDGKEMPGIFTNKEGKEVGAVTPDGKVYTTDGKGNWTDTDGKTFKGKFALNKDQELVETREGKDGQNTEKTYKQDGKIDEKTVDSPELAAKKAKEAEDAKNAEEAQKNKDLGFPEDIKRNNDGRGIITEFTDQGSVWSRGEDGKFRPAGSPDFPNPRSEVKEENGVLSYKQRRQPEPAGESEIKVDRNNGTREETYTEGDVKHTDTFNRNDKTRTSVETNNNNGLEISKAVTHNAGQPNEWTDTTNTEGRTISQGGGKNIIQIKPDGSYHLEYSRTNADGSFSEVKSDYPADQVMHNPIGNDGKYQILVKGEQPLFFNPDGTVTDK